MPIAHFFAEGIGPFKSVHLDLRGADGHPALGPHILAGVNGSGKSTVLKAIAWCLAGQDDEFPMEEWSHFLRGHARPRLLLVFDVGGEYRCARAIASALASNADLEGFKEWITERLAQAELVASDFGQESQEGHSANGYFIGLGSNWLMRRGCNVAAYSSARSLRYVDRPEMALPRDKVMKGRFGFETAVQNEAIHSWLLGLYSKRAIAKERHESSSRYTESFAALERALQSICGEDVSIVVDIEPNFQPRLRIGSQTLNLSQIPDGVKTTLGWMADFMMRADAMDWDARVAELKPGLLLFDEIEGFLHPKWQRMLLPAIREALPTTQSIVTSHSPFVISSCRHAMVHVLKLNKDGAAYAEPPVSAPIGESITSTLKGIFGVDSRFDVETEKDLGEWNALNKLRQQRKLSSTQQTRFRDLSRILASRSEELRSLVHPVLKLPKATVDKLTEIPGAPRSRKRHTASR